MFTLLGDYSDSMEQASLSRKEDLRQKYEKAQEFYNRGEYQRAEMIFDKLGDFQDSADMRRLCLQILETETEQKSVMVFDSAGKLRYDA